MWQEDVEVDGGLKQRVRVRTASSEMSDPRLTGTVTVTDNADRFFDGTDTLIGDVLWGTIAIENDEGTWTGPLTGTSDVSADGRGNTYIELVGAGAYEGLSAVLFERESAQSDSTGTASSSLATCRPTASLTTAPAPRVRSVVTARRTATGAGLPLELLRETYEAGDVLRVCR